MAILLTVAGEVLAAGQATGNDIDFDRDIRPILSDKCYQCHGPDAGSREAGLRLDTRAGATEYAIVPGSPEFSEVINRITAEDEDYRMPPLRSNLSLTDEEKHLLQQWIAEGAKYTDHWAFRPLPDKVSVPHVADSDWPRNTIDRFILARLEAEQLVPSPQAEPLRLLRRVTLDLTGLPPTPEEIEKFEKRAKVDVDAALNEAVDRLLSSSTYGEHMAVGWLDAARYADSYGYQSDMLNTQWPYRDWVVRALNENLPYDQFLTWQLAGDLLDNPTKDQILATAFNRMHRMTNEGGSIAEEWLVENAADRVHTFGTAVLGLTLECSRCHDHKFDPISQRDYYALSAFFNSIDENGLYDHTDKVPSPSLLLPTAGEQAALDEARQAVADAEAALLVAEQESDERFEEWLAHAQKEYSTLPDQVKHVTFEGELYENEKRGSTSNDIKIAEHAQRILGVEGQGVRFDGDHGLVYTDIFQIDRWDHFTLDFWVRDTLRNPLPVVLLHRTRGMDVGYNGFDVMLTDGILDVRLYRIWPGNAIGIRSKQPIEADAWQHLTVTYDGSSRARGLRLYVDGQEVATEVIRDRVHKSVAQVGNGDGYFTLGERFRDRGFRDGEMDELRVFDRNLTPLEVAHLHGNTSLANAIENPDSHREALWKFYCSAIDPQMRAQRDTLREARKKLVMLEEPIQEVSVMEELDRPRPTYVLARGAYDAPKSDETRVQRDVFEEILLPFPEDAPRDRLGLARWATDLNHPLTARVFVNRIWARFFGQGLVKTPENFGRQGEAPSHPKLLDWLSRDFVAHGWDIKRLCKQLVLSATYRQDSRLRSDLAEKDPENQLLARGPSRRLSAEQIRDLALSASGLLVPTMGGPPVAPYQPGEDLWKESNAMSPAYEQSTDEGLYRRSLYSVWKRTAPLPNMLSFDAPTREVCVVSRPRTNTPLQALVLLNDVQFVEAARAIAEKVAHTETTTEERLAEAFLRMTGRYPDSVESQLLREMYEEQLTLFENKAEQDVQKLIEVGDSPVQSELPPAELAALTVTCQAILNYDATIYER